MNENVLVLTLDSNAFAKMKEDFNNVLKKTLGNMRIKESNDATLTLKLNISLTETEAPDFDSANVNAMRKIHKPRFDHKISSVMQIKNEESGSLKGEYELVWDEDLEDWIMKPIDNGQRSLFDDDVIYADVVEVDVEEEGTDVAALPPAKKLLGDGNTEGEAVGGYDYEEGEGDE